MNDKKRNSTNKRTVKNDGSRTGSSPSRRRALLAGGGTLLGAAALPKQWVTPVLQTVMLPAHAQTSGTVLGGRLNVQITSAGDWLDTLVPRAEAAPPIVELIDGCIILEFIGDTVNATLLSGYFGSSSKSGPHDPVSGNFSVNNISDGGSNNFDVSGTSSGGSAPTSASGKVKDESGYKATFNATLGGATCTPIK